VSEQRTTAETRAALREEMARRRNSKKIFGVTLFQSDLTDLLDDADALAGALAEVARLRTALATVLAAGNTAYNMGRVDGGRPIDPYIECVIDTAADALADDAPGQGEEGEGR
jgi:hypothetical protein